METRQTFFYLPTHPSKHQLKSVGGEKDEKGRHRQHLDQVPRTE